MNDNDDKLDFEEAAFLAETMAVGEHVEEVESGGKRVRRKGVFFLPTLITLTALFAGFYAIVVAMEGHYQAAVFAILIAGVCDGLDGRVARLTNTQSAFGAELDSLADMVSFGVAPALIMFSWTLNELGRWGWAVAFIYAACAAMRLARFNTEIGEGGNSSFKGLASPPAAGLIISFVWFFTDWGLYDASGNLWLSIFAAFITFMAGGMMVTNIEYNSFKQLNFSGRVPFVVILLAVFVFSLVSVDPAVMLLIIAFSYAFSGPITTLWGRFRKPAAVQEP